MSHEITQFTDELASYVYLENQPAWHALGQPMPPGTDVIEALGRAYLLNHDVQMEAARILTEDGTVHATENYILTRNNPADLIEDKEDVQREVVLDDKGYARLFTEKYEILQFEDLGMWTKDLIGVLLEEYEDAQVTSVGGIYNMTTCFICVELPKSVVAGDDYRRFITTATSHTGDQAARADIGRTRVVCANTYNFNLSTCESSFVVRHRSTMQDRLADARETLKIQKIYDKALDQKIERLAEIDFNNDDLKRMVSTLYTPEAQFVRATDADVEVLEFRSERQEANFDYALSRIKWLFEHSPRPQDQQHVGTAYGALNAATEFNEWLAKNRPRDDTKRTTSALYGTIAARNQQVLDYMEEQVLQPA